MYKKGLTTALRATAKSRRALCRALALLKVGNGKGKTILYDLVTLPWWLNLILALVVYFALNSPPTVTP